MRAPSGQTTAPALQALLTDGALAGEWVLDPGKSSIRLTTRSMGLVPVNGVFREVSGNGTVSPDGEVSGTVTVAAASIDTENARRDAHLRSADFFDSGMHPDIIFTADGIRPAGQGVAVTGALTVRGHTRPLSFDAAASIQGDGEIRLDAEVHINRADFGLSWNLMGMASMNNTLTIHATFTRRWAQFPNEWPSDRAEAERQGARIVSWNTYDRGGHYPAHQAPDLLVQDMREFFARCLAHGR